MLGVKNYLGKKNVSKYMPHIHNDKGQGVFSKDLPYGGTYGHRPDSIKGRDGM